jgi:hypothetical protein
MIWLPLLLATLAESNQGQASRGRLQQLKGRLGLTTSKLRGTAARLAWVEATYGLAVRQGLEFFLLETEQVGRPVEGIGGVDSWTALPGVTFQTPSGPVQELQRSWKADPPLSELYEGFEGLHLDGGLRVEIDELLPWLGLQVHRRMQATQQSSRESALQTAQGIQRQLEGHTMDFLDAERPEDLMSLSVEQVLELSAAWHDRFANTAGFGTPARPGLVVYRWPDGSTLQRLVTRQQLEQEGQSMGHCVGTFWSQVRDDESLIFSYRLASGVSVATMEIGRDRWDATRLAVEQLYGPRNQAVSPQVRDRIWAWVIAEIGLRGHLTSSLRLPKRLQEIVDRDGPMSEAELAGLSSSADLDDSMSEEELEDLSSGLRQIARGLYDVRGNLEAAWAMNRLASRSWTPAQLADFGHENGWSYTPTVDDFRAIEQSHVNAIPASMDDAIGRIARAPAMGGPTWCMWDLRERSGLQIPGWRFWAIYPYFSNLREKSWTLAMRTGQANEVEFRVYAPGWWLSAEDLDLVGVRGPAPDPRLARTLDDFTAVSDIGPLRALRDADFLLTDEEEAAHEAAAIAAEMTGTATLSASAVRAPLLDLLRVARDQGIELDRDAQRLLRRSP